MGDRSRSMDELTQRLKVALGHAPDSSVDVYRDTPLRYMGYCNEVGEAFRPLTSRAFVISTYVGSMSYVCADSYDKAQKARAMCNDPAKKDTKMAVAAADCFIWQTLASVAIPGWVIHKIVDVTKSQTGHMSKIVAKSVPTIMGLACIPLIIHPIDYVVEEGMEMTLRP